MFTQSNPWNYLLNQCSQNTLMPAFQSRLALPITPISWRISASKLLDLF